MVVFNGSTLAIIHQLSWFTTSDTQIASVAIGNVTGDLKNEIVTAGSFFDNTQWNGQLVVWDGSTLAVVKQFSWHWISNTSIASVAIGDINADGNNEIVTGGTFFDNTRSVAQLVVFNGSTLAIINQVSWFSISDTQIASVAIGDVNGDLKNEIVTAGSFFDNTRTIAQLVYWNGSTMAVVNQLSWFTTGSTEVTSVFP